MSNFTANEARERLRRFANSPYSVYEDANGNFMLVCISEHDSGRVYLPVKVLEAFTALACRGEKWVRFRHAPTRFDIVRRLADLDLPSPVEKPDRAPFHLIGKGDIPIPGEASAFPAYAGDADIPF